MVAIVSLMAYVASFAISLGPIFWLLNAEIYPLSVRSKAAGIGTMANWTFNFIVSLTFLLLIEALGRTGAFWFYGAIGLLTLWFCWKLVPETKGKRLEDIQAYFQDRVRQAIAGRAACANRSPRAAVATLIAAHANRRDPRRAASPTFSVEFFPPKTAEATEQLFATARALRELEPDFVSVTYGAGGSTRDGTVEITDGAEGRARPRDDGAPELRRRDAPRAWRRSSTGSRAAGIENVFALRGDPPRGEADFVPARGRARQRRRAGGVHRRAATTSRSAAPAFPRSTPRPPSLDADLAYLKTKVEAGRRAS